MELPNENATLNKQTFSIKDLPCESVVVYSDRAEVKRLLKTVLNKGESELTIQDISKYINHDSVRVEGYGEASVLDVVCQSKRVESIRKTSNTDQAKKIKDEIKELGSKLEITEQKLDRLEKQTNLLNDYANSLAKIGISSNTKEPKSNSSSSNSKDDIQNFLNFLDAYSSRLEKLDEEKSQVHSEKTRIREQINVAHGNLNSLHFPENDSNTQIVILVEAVKPETEIFLFVSYLLYNASWIPKYDIKVFSKDKSMIINYYGMIYQSTGEDWNDTKLSLSTAIPSMGGDAPELETQNVRIKYAPSPKIQNDDYIRVKQTRDFASQIEGSSSHELRQESFHLLDEAIPIIVRHSKVEKSTIGSTSTFDIPRKATIPSDNSTHKVSIGVINLKPDFEYESVPRKNPHAFIKAKVINKSDFSLLAGPANVFLDNNFVAKTQLKSYSPLEEFVCSLGVDPAIRIEYKPLKKFQSQAGVVTKSTSISYVQTIEIKNTSSNSAKLLLKESVPLSNDEKIQVKLLEPNLKSSQNIRLNKSNNLEFDLLLEPSQTEEINIKYIIEYPPKEEIEFFNSII